MRYFFSAVLMLLILGACAPQDRIYDVTEIDEPPAIVGDSIVIEAPAPSPRPERGGAH